MNWFNTITQLTGKDTTTVPQHTIYWVDSIRDTFRFEKSNAATADAITIIQPTTGPGRWIRQNVPAPDWLLQATWFIDPSGGNDENTGVDSGHALKTDAELVRRWGGNPTLTQATTVTYVGSPPGTSALRATIGANSNLVITGQTTTIASGTLTGFTAFNRATQQANQVTDTGLAGGFAAHVGRLMRIRTGPRAGTQWFIAKDLGGGSARISTPGTPTAGTTDIQYGRITRVTPQVGDVYDIFTLPVINVGMWQFSMSQNQPTSSGFGYVQIKQLDLQFNSYEGGLYSSLIPVEAQACRMEGPVIGSDYFLGRQVNFVGGEFGDFGSDLFIAASLLLGVQADVSSGSLVGFDYDTLFQDCQLIAFDKAKIDIGSACLFDTHITGALDIDSGSTVTVRAQADGVAALWGTGNTGYGIKVHSGGCLVYTLGNPPTVNSGLGTGREILIGGNDKLLTDIPYTEDSNGAIVGVRF